MRHLTLPCRIANITLVGACSKHLELPPRLVGLYSTNTKFILAGAADMYQAGSLMPLSAFLWPIRSSGIQPAATAPAIQLQQSLVSAAPARMTPAGCSLAAAAGTLGPLRTACLHWQHDGPAHSIWPAKRPAGLRNTPLIAVHIFGLHPGVCS
jgi:hypothetical protein